MILTVKDESPADKLMKEIQVWRRDAKKFGQSSLNLKTISRVIFIMTRWPLMSDIAWHILNEMASLAPRKSKDRLSLDIAHFVAQNTSQMIEARKNDNP